MAISQDPPQLRPVPPAAGEAVWADVSNRLRLLQEAGALDALTDGLLLLAQLKDLLDDTLVSGLGAALSAGMEALDALNAPAVQVLLRALADDGGELTAALLRPRPVAGFTGFIRALKDPAVQRGLGMVVAVLHQLGSAAEGRGATTSPA